jgi:hypothetical protein
VPNEPEMRPRESSEGARHGFRLRWDPRGALACPSCGEGGRSAFEERGNDEETGDAILRCTGCLSGMTVRSRRGFPRRQPRLIDPDTWSRMEIAWANEPLRAASTAPDPIDDPEQLVLALRERGFAGEVLTHLVAETLSTSTDEAALLIAETTARRVA